MATWKATCRHLARLELVTGTMQEQQQYVFDVGNPYLLFVDACLRGMGQCMFCNNPLTGLFVFMGACANSYYAAFMGLAGLLGATLTAYAILPNPKKAVGNGLFGFSGMLCGLVLALFHFGSDEHFDYMPWAFIAPVLLGSLSSFLMSGMANLLIPTFGIAPLGLPFVTLAYMWIMACTGGLMSYYPVRGALLSPAVLANPLEYSTPPAQHYTAEALARAYLMNIGNSAFSASEVSGVFFLVGIFICSPISGLMAMLGSVMALVFQVAFGISQGMVSTGLLGFNSVLTGLALGNFMVLVGYKVWLWLLAGLFYTFVLTAGLTSAFTPLGIPVLGLPFTVVVWTMVLSARDVPGLYLVPLNSMTFPEDHRASHRPSKLEMELGHARTDEAHPEELGEPTKLDVVL
eukprot:TRINITY_DN58092_c0_g1_i1.p1 TRINITY_DN58092_c0_g1~~TRINITY_DN58092_c0_g1_i1.p1  ORF type:complete len:404 (+),score=27.58 TRINITY_DN58092_c0_g1_i1:133-1344(+)